ncbi:MAG: HlyC/CorC family transporter [Rhizomicrobium sp.]
MDIAILLTCVGLLLLMALSAFFSGSETALTAVSRGKMLQLEKDGSRAAGNVNKLMHSRERMIGALLLGNTFVNILASSLATAVFEHKLGHKAVAIITLVMTLLILVFSEVLPKTLAIVRTDRFALTVAGTVRKVVAVLGPIVVTVQFLVWRLLRLIGVQHHVTQSAELAHDEIRGTVYLRHQEGTVERESRDMISAVLDLSDLTVSDVMCHRKNMVTISADRPVPEIVRALTTTQHSRIPVWRDQPENIIGVLHTRTVVRTVLTNRGSLSGIDIDKMIRPPFFVPETTSLEELLASFRERRSHFALVVDEYGVILGLVTREDVLDEIFGKLPDEGVTKIQSNIHPQADGSLVVEGITPIRDLNRAFDWNLPDEEATTIAGLVIHEARTIPDAGQRFAFYGYEFEILRRQRNQITVLRIIPPGTAD